MKTGVLNLPAWPTLAGVAKRVADLVPVDELPRPLPPRFSNHLLSTFVQAVVEWTREHHPERLSGSEDEQTVHKL